MSDNRESYNPADRFSEHFRQRLKTYPTVPDKGCWDEIEARLRAKRTFSTLRFGASVAASILIAICVLTHLLIKKDREVEENLAYHEKYSIEHPVTKKEKPTEKRFVTDTGAVAVAVDKPIDPEHRIPAAGKTAGKPPLDAVDEAATEPQVDTPGEVIMRDTSVVTDGRQPDIKEENEPDETSGARAEKHYRTFDDMTAYNMPDKNRRAKRRGWQIAAGFSSFGGFSSSNPFADKAQASDPGSIYNPGDAEGPLFADGEDDDPGELSQEKITDVKPAIPFSAGIMLQKRWNKTLGIETGLVYTRLSSDLAVESAIDRYDAVLNLHYLGVPVNLTVNLREKDRFCLYVSGGGMVEKGIRSVYKRKTPLWNNLMIKDRSSRISGLQWSLNGSVGISYNFYKDMNLYIEPGISYYFDCNQPVSRRTEDPLSFSFRLGVRYDF
jgi:hypothetical protein